MENNALVSIVVPVYNMSTKLKSCISSLLKQTYKKIEIILVDDGSKDDSYQVCLEIEASDNRVKTIHTENQGPGPARNCGIEHSIGKYLYFADADDLLDENAIAILVNTIENSGADVIVFGFNIIDTKGKIISTKSYDNIVLDGSVVRKEYADYASLERPFAIQGAPWNKFFKRELIDRYEITFPPLRRHQDEAFIARYITHVNIIQFISDILYSYFANDLRKEWDKYPATYIDAVIGLYEDRKQNMLIWCDTDHELHGRVHAGYITGVIKALELSFSPKFEFHKAERINWIKQSVEKSDILSVTETEYLGRYHKHILELIKQNSFERLYAMLWFKVCIEKHGLLRTLKRVFRRSNCG
ncbi:MAG: glycosyltransferase family 2 protein [Fastidiosipilaceae bacterium]|jgi:glycosyltransferase involved in cell wall biosynthesis